MKNQLLKRISQCYSFLLLTTFLLNNGGYASEVNFDSILAVRVPSSQKKISDDILTANQNSSIHKIHITNNSKYLSENLTQAFVSARDPAVTFDGKHIYFSGQKDSSDFYHIYRMDVNGLNLMQITSEDTDHFSPLQVGTLFYLNDSFPTPQIIYCKVVQRTPRIYSLFAANPDGSNPRQITHNIFSDIEPDVLPNGRLIFSSHTDPDSTGEPVGQLMAVNIDGTDLMPVSGDQNRKQHHRMPRTGFNDTIYFIEKDYPEEHSGGRISSFNAKRPLHSRKVITQHGDFLYPCPLPNGTLLASWKNADGEYELVSVSDESTHRSFFSERGNHYLDPQILIPRRQVSGRSSVVGFKYKDTGVFFCMNVYESDQPEIQSLTPGSIKEVLITEGRLEQGKKTSNTLLAKGIKEDDQLFLQHHILGRAPVEKDGSFQVRVPSETPVTFHLLDREGRILGSQKSWTWVMHGESRGCIGCHEDRELSPPNTFIDAVKKPPKVINPPDAQRIPIVIGGDL